MKALYGRHEKKERIVAYASIIPILLFHCILIFIPGLINAYSSFTDWSGLGPKKFIGLANYIELVRDPNVIEAFANNLTWMFLFLSIPIVIALIIGFFLSTVPRGRIIFRAIYFMPYVISAAIAGKIFAAFFNPYFGINIVLDKFGLDFFMRDWLSPKNSLFSVAFVDMWHWWGFLLVIFLSALQQIDPMYYESVTLEGANTFQKFWYITLPSIKQSIIFIVLITMVWSISTFEYVWVMTRGSPGSELLSTLLYKNAYLKYRAGYASAISVVQLLISSLIFAIFGFIRKKVED